MIVCIAEKPSVARDLARILGATHTHPGFIEGNGYAVTWAFGHLCTLKDPQDYQIGWKRWCLSDLPIIPPGRFGIKLKEDEGIKKQFAIIKELVSKAEYVINCGDAGQEGELIQRWILQLAECNCPVKRLWISSLTDQAIKEGFSQLKTEEELRPLFYAGLARAIGDWLLGINATRLYTVRYAHSKQILSVGRVQTPTLALIVNRQREIEQFTPVTTYILHTTYNGVLFKSEEEPFSTIDDALKKAEAITDQLFEIKKIEKKTTKEYPPKLFDLTSLQVEANKKFGFTAEETLQTIQSLYEKKLTTYPRVDTTYLPEDMYPKIISILKGIAPHPHCSCHVAPLLQGSKISKSKKVFDNKKITDHHAIVPTGIAPTHLEGKELSIYNLVALRFIAAFYPEAHIANTTVKGIAGDISFKTTGRMIIKEGWHIVLKDSSTKSSNTISTEETKPLPSFSIGETGAHCPEVKESTSQPPKLYTEATLLRAMETAGKMVEDEELRDLLKENGIGRPSTRAAIIETLFKRGYIVRDGKSIRATTTGIELIETILNPLLKSAELTGIWERKLRQIEREEYDVNQFMVELKEMVALLINEVLCPAKRTDLEM